MFGQVKNLKEYNENKNNIHPPNAVLLYFCLCCPHANGEQKRSKGYSRIRGAVRQQVPVPEAIDNGQNHNTNLYWGCGYGIRTFFKKSKEWELLSTRGKNGIVLERLVFKHATKNYYLIADAYDGQYNRV